MGLIIPQFIFLSPSRQSLLSGVESPASRLSFLKEGVERKIGGFVTIYSQ